MMQRMLLVSAVLSQCDFYMLPIWTVFLKRSLAFTVQSFKCLAHIFTTEEWKLDDSTFGGCVWHCGFCAAPTSDRHSQWQCASIDSSDWLSPGHRMLAALDNRDFTTMATSKILFNRNEFGISLSWMKKKEHTHSHFYYIRCFKRHVRKSSKTRKMEHLLAALTTPPLTMARDINYSTS